MLMCRFAYQTETFVRHRFLSPTSTPLSLHHSLLAMVSISKVFDHPQADIILESSDGVQFKIRKIHLQGKKVMRMC